jgi:hypothetical protein
VLLGIFKWVFDVEFQMFQMSFRCWLLSIVVRESSLVNSWNAEIVQDFHCSPVIIEILFNKYQTPLHRYQINRNSPNRLATGQIGKPGNRSNNASSIPVIQEPPNQDKIPYLGWDLNPLPLPYQTMQGVAIPPPVLILIQRLTPPSLTRTHNMCNYNIHNTHINL